MSDLPFTEKTVVTECETGSRAGPEVPRIEFPCEGYPIKVMGEAGTEFHQFVLTVMERHAPGFDQSKVTVRDSRQGRFQSITVFVTATGEPQLKAIFEELKTSQLIKMVL